MALYAKTKTGEYELTQLQAEINADATVVPSCVSISATGENLDLDFAAALSAGEETQVDALILAHTVTPEAPDISDLPLSDIEGAALAVHPSYKPRLPDGDTYAVWTGAGDDVVTPALGGGELLHFDMVVDQATTQKQIRFDFATFGRVWLHEAYMKFTGAGEGDYISANIVAEASALQTSVNLDLELDGDIVKFAAGGAGTGTHGFAGTPTLIPRGYSNDGDWDYDGVTLTPNVGGTGKFRISTVDTPAHRFVNKIPCYGDCSTYFSMTSDETAELNAGYYIEATVYNTSNTAWHLSILLEIYRERTVDP